MTYTTINASQINDYFETNDIFIIDKKEKRIHALDNLSFYKVHVIIKYMETNKDGRYEIFAEEE